MEQLLLEREREVEAIDVLVRGVISGSGGTAVVQAPPGLGKSRLLLAATPPPSAELRIARFTCGELEREYPWSAAAGLFGPALAEGSPDADAQLFAGSASPAAELLKDPAGLSGADVDGFSIVHGFYVILERLVEAGPLLLILDDAHWSDAPSLQLFRYLQRRLPRIAAGLLIAARPAPDAEQRGLLNAIMGDSATRTFDLGALSQTSVSELVKANAFPDATEALCEACARVTGGNPFLVHELLIGLQAEEADPEDALKRLLAIPPDSVSRSVLLRLGRLLVPQALDLARAVAVLDDGTTMRHAGQLAQVDPARVASVADALAGAIVLAPGEPLRFVHPLVRAAIYADMPGAERAQAHAAAAALLEADGAAPQLVAVHLLQVPATNSPRTVKLLRAAAASARHLGAPHAAVRYLLRALREPPPSDAHAEVLVELADAESRAGVPAAVEHLRAALQLVESPRQGAILLALGWAEHHAGQFGRAAEAFDQGLRATDPDQTELVADLEAGYLQSATLDAARAPAAAARIDEIEATAEKLHSAPQRLLLAQVLFARSVSGRDRAGVIDLALRLWADGRLLQEEGAASQTIWHVVGALSWADAFAPAYRIIDAALRTAETEGVALAYARGRYARSWPNFWTGRIAEAAADARAAVDIWYGGLETYLPAAIYWLVLSELERDDVAAAEGAMVLAGSLERWYGTGMEGFYVAAEGHIAAHRGDVSRAFACQMRCGELMNELQVTNPSVMPWRTHAAAAAALAGDDDQGRRLADEELELARAVGSPRAIGVALRASGILSAKPVNLRLLEDSVEALRHSGATLEYARSLVELGAAIRRSGQRSAARQRLHQGLALAEEAGATVLAARARSELQAARGRVSGRPDGGPEALTASERRVCALAAEGQANRLIAARLQVSVKAVEWHLSQAYRKLGIAGRRQLRTALQDGPG